MGEDYTKGYVEGFRRAMEIASAHVEHSCPYPKRVLGSSSVYALALRIKQMGAQVEGHNWAEAYKIAAALKEVKK